MSSGPHTETGTLAPADVEALCENIWPSEATARRMADSIEDAGYSVMTHAAPIRTANRGVMSVAWVRHPFGSEVAPGRTIGDIRFRAEPGS